MRKLLNIIGITSVLLMSSCELDKMPVGGVDPKDACQDLATVESMCLGTYSLLRANYSSANMTFTDIQTDYATPLMGFSNTFGEAYKWTYLQDNEFTTNVWNCCYVTIAQCNFILDGTKYNAPTKKDEEGRLKLVQARLYLMRAMSYSMLVDRFCGDYDAAKAKTDYGMPLVLKYDPTVKPTRASLYDTYQAILADLNSAQTLFETVLNGSSYSAQLQSQARGVANATYFNIDCVTALRAHVYLQMHLYNEAYSEADKLITQSTAYGFENSYEEFDDAWTYDRGNEVIFKFAASKTELPSSYGQMFCVENFNHLKYESEGLLGWRPEYLPTKDVVEMYDKTDYRYKSWFYTSLPYMDTQGKEVSLLPNGYYVISGYTMLTKFDGNPDLRTDNSWNYANAWKVFRLGEIYLIAAEAAANGAAGDATTLINTLRAHRGLEALPVVTMDEVKTERFKEMLLEGQRLTDLKRWGDQMKRGMAQKGDIYKVAANQKDLEPVALDADLSIEISRELTIQPTDYRFVWPIPFSEIYANQNLQGQQNPGWDK